MSSFCDPDKIKVSPDRFRLPGINDPGIVELSESIEEVGQLQPILVDDDWNLIAGLRRLLSCKRLKRDVWFVTESTAKLILDNPYLRRAAEYQENLRRQEFTPAERALATAELDRLMREVYGDKKSGPGVVGWTQEDTAKKLGFKSHRTVSEALLVAKAIEVDLPGVKDAKTMQEAVGIVKKHTRLLAAEELAKRRVVTDPDAEIQDPQDFFSKRIILGDCLEKMKGLASGICNLFVTDPPWGIDMDDAVEDRGSTSMKAVGTYEDGKSVIPLLKEVIKEMYRVGHEHCYVVMFCGVRHWLEISEAFRKAGFSIYSKMLIWVKTRSAESLNLNISRSHAPAIWPNSAYDAMVLARKGQPTLAQMGRPDVFFSPPVPSNERIHQAQKPLFLLEEIIRRFYHPGTNPLLIDPFAGSGSTLTAARRVGIKKYFGFELSSTNRDRAIAEMVNQYMKDLDRPESSMDIDLEEFE